MNLTDLLWTLQNCTYISTPDRRTELDVLPDQA